VRYTQGDDLEGRVYLVGVILMVVNVFREWGIVMKATMRMIMMGVEPIVSLDTLNRGLREAYSLPVAEHLDTTCVSR
jgi:hypothetical protein